MNCVELVNMLVEEGTTAYKKRNRNTPRGRQIERHEKTPLKTILGEVEVSCWKELSVMRTAEQIKEWIPSVEIEVNLEENNSNLCLTMNDDEERVLVNKIYTLLKKANKI